MSNFIYRKFYAPDLENIKPSSFIVRMHQSPREELYEVNGMQWVDVLARVEQVEAFMAEDYESQNFHTFLHDLLSEGLVKLEDQAGFPKDRILAVSQNFLEGGCENIWTMASRSPKGLGLKGALIAEMSPEEFKLDFVLSEGGVELHRERVYRSEPSEISWHRHGFRKLNYEDGRFWIVSTTGWNYNLDAPMLPPN